MLRTLRTVLGTTAVLIGISLVGVALPARRAGAVPAAPPCNATAIPQVFTSAPQAEADFAVPTSTCTPVRIVRTATPTFTATVPATNTPEPTVAPTDTPVPPSSTATSPAGGAGAAGISPPSTGSGPASTSGTDALALAAGAMLFAGGAGSLALGARRRR